MNKKLALVAASVIAISAYTNANAQDVETQPAEEQGALGTLFSDEQPPLEGDSPLVDEEATVATNGDDALVGEPYAEDDVEALPAAPEFADETDPLATPDTDVMTAQELPYADVEQEDPAFADTDPMVADDPMMGDEPELATDADADGYLNDADRTAMTRGGAIDAAPTADSGTMDTVGTDTTPMTADAAPTDDAEMTDDAVITADAEPSEPLPAPDVKIAAVPTDPTEAVAEAALIAGTYEVTIPNRQGTSTLFIEGRGTEAAGTFDGEPIDVIVTGRNFSFDAPVEMNGEEQLMTFAGTAEDGVIDNGVIEAQGDGGYLTFDARRVDAASTDAMSGDMDSGDMSTGDMDIEASGSDADAMDTDAMSDDAMNTDMEADTDEAETGFGATGSDVLDDAGDDAGFGETYDDEATGFGTEEDAGIDTMDADTGVMGGSDVMDTDSASDALTTDGGLEGDADDMGADSTLSNEPMTDEPMMDDADSDVIDPATGADAATEGDVMEDDMENAGDPNFEF